jgi:hypothetical protein
LCSICLSLRLILFRKAIGVIWKNQHPPDCKKAKYLIAEGFHQGYGSELHVYGVVLALAVDMGRVFLQKGGWTWRFKNKFCESQGKKSLECYYHPWTPCTLEDAAYAAYKDKTSVLKVPAVDTWAPSDDQKLIDLVKKYGSRGFWEEIAQEFGDRTPTQCGNRWKSLREPLKLKEKGDAALRHAIHHDERSIADYDELGWKYPFHRIETSNWNNGRPQFIIPPLKHGKQSFPNETLAIDNEFLLKDVTRTFVPKQFVPMLTCAGMKLQNQYLWWRAISISYFIRPNQATLKLLKEHQDEYLKSVNGQCASTYIRHGDKGIEMQLVQTSTYITVADQIWQREELPSGMLSGQQKVFYVASDDYEAMERVKEWGRTNNVVVRYSNLSQTILSDRVKVLKQHDMERGFRKSREMEYFSYILHLADTIQCEVFICTYPSNYCRLIDELRTTVGGKANRLSVDLSMETCPTRPPCYRSHGLGNFIGDVHDPKLRLWR